jgi:hypothetical protein
LKYCLSAEELVFVRSRRFFLVHRPSTKLQPLPFAKMLRTTLVGARGAPRLPITMRSSFQRSNPINTPLRAITRRTITSGPSRPSKSSTSFTFTSHARPQKQTLLQRIRSLRFFHNTRPRRNGRPSPDPTPNLNSGGAAAEAEPQSLGARMRKLSREYGWSAIGVYFALTALDFPFCYLFVRQMGTDKIGEFDSCLYYGRSAVSCLW